MSATKMSLAELFRRRFRRRFTDPGALRGAFRRARAGEILPDLETEEFGQADAGRRLISGRFAFAGETVAPSGPRAMWRDQSPSAPWLIEAHSFDWLADLAAVGGAPASSAAAHVLDAWIKECAERYDPLIWREDVAARRLRALILHARLALPKESAKRDRALRAVSAHGEWLSRRIETLAPGAALLRSAIAMAELSLCVGGWEDRRDEFAKALDDALSGSVLADGCPISRNPEDALIFFAQTRLLRGRYAELGAAPPPLLDAAVDALALATRFFRAPDGGLPLFHGAREAADGRVEAQLSRVRLPQIAPQSLTEGRYERMSGGRVCVFVDVGAAASGPSAETAHASALALEMHVGRRRLLVGCGSAAHLSPDWALALRGGAAHSGLTLDEAPFALIAEPPQGADPGAAALVAGPAGAVGERKQERNGVWVLGRHDGYLEDYGARLTRRLFLSSDGGDFRGEDSVLIDDQDMRRFQRRLAKAPRAQREAGLPFTARFHLHPSVVGAMVADGEAVTLRSPSGEIWVMRQAGGTLALTPSVYVGAGGAPRPTQQIVITAGAREATTQIRWAFRRVGDLNALPKDLEALEPKKLESERAGQKTVAPPPFKA